MEKFERKIGTLTEKNLDVFRKLRHCLNAGRLAKVVRIKEELEKKK